MSDNPFSRNYLMDRYYNKLMNKFNNNKNTKYDYFVFYCYYLNLIKHLYCLNEGIDTRLLLYDATIFLGGLPQYNSIFLILFCSLSAMLYKLIYMSNPDEFKWVQFWAAYTGKLNPLYIDIYKDLYNEEEFRKVQNFAKIILKLTDIFLQNNG